MPDPIKLVGTHPEDSAARTHRLTVYVLDQHTRHIHATLVSECGFTMDVAISGRIYGSDDEPTCDECRTHGLSAKVLSDVLGALARAGKL